jgi:hypothetical protein
MSNCLKIHQLLAKMNQDQPKIKKGIKYLNLSKLKLAHKQHNYILTMNNFIITGRVTLYSSFHRALILKTGDNTNFSFSRSRKPTSKDKL